jgi:hypothetical protein
VSRPDRRARSKALKSSTAVASKLRLQQSFLAGRANHAIRHQDRGRDPDRSRVVAKNSTSLAFSPRGSQPHFRDASATLSGRFRYAVLVVNRTTDPDLWRRRSYRTFSRLGAGASAHFPKFAVRLSTSFSELRKAIGTSELMIPVPLIDLKSPNELAAYGAGTSDRRYWRAT